MDTTLTVQWSAAHAAATLGARTGNDQSNGAAYRVAATNQVRMTIRESTRQRYRPLNE